MIPSPVAAMDLKIAQNKNSTKNSKGKDDKSFAKEISASEKKLKKKSAHEESLSAQQSQHRENVRHNESKADRRDSESAVQKRGNEGVLVKNEIINGNSNGVQNSASEEINVESLAEGIISENEGHLLPQNINPIKDMTGKISLEGMQMINPQTFPQLNSESIEPTQLQNSNSETLMAIPGEQASKESLLKDQLGDSNGSQDMQFDFTSELPQNSIQNKEVVKNQQLFAQVLENKTNNVENLRKENVDYLVQQASTILKDGGGEMKLQLRPEGLGTVDLKVGVHQGQVSIEIMAQDKDVKKLFDDSIIDIRSALETQNLKVDTLKVGVSDNFDSSMAQRQFQMMDQDFARNFMGQFRDERQSLRQQGIDSFIGNKSPLDSKPEGLQPLQNRVLGSSRLNIVA